MAQSSLTTEELAARWNLTSGTLARWRRNGEGPPFSKTDGGVSYKLGDIEAYEKSRTFQSISDYPPELRHKKKSEKAV